MAIRLVKFGGTDFTSTFVASADMNDTIDEIVRIVDNGN